MINQAYLKKIASNKGTLTATASNVAILILPILIFHWMVPFVSNWTLGNDYPRYSIHNQLEIQFALKTGTFPLYIPGYSGGQSASALTTGQVFHPISHLASWMPGYWNGKALDCITLLRLLSLGLVHLVLFAFLKRLQMDGVLAFLLAFVTVYNLRMLDLFRYGSSLEAWTGHLLLCAAVGWYYLEPTKWKGPLTIIGATYLLVCSGHPQMMFLGLLGSSLFILLIPYFCGLMLSDKPYELRYVFGYWLRIFIFCGIGVALSSAYVMPFYFDFIANNVSRIGKGYAWAVNYQDTLMGTINNFFRPLRAGVEGVFGGASLFLMAALVPAVRICRVKVPFVIWTIWGIMVAVFLHMQGASTPVHYLTWKYLPLADSFRIAGRISMIMPVLIMLILAWIVQKSAIISPRGRTVLKTPLMILGSAALIFMIVYSLVPNTIVSQTSTYTASTIRDIPFWVEPSAVILGALALIVAVTHNYMLRLKKVLGLLLCLITCLQVSLLLQYGTWIEHKQDTPKLSRMRADKKERLDYNLTTASGMENSIIHRHLQHSFLEPFLGKIYHRYRTAIDNQMAYGLMQDYRRPDEAIIEKLSSSQDEVKRPGSSSQEFSSVKLTYSSYNRLIFDIRTSRHGFFSLAYPYTKKWKAYVNGTETPLYRVNGAYLAVKVPIAQCKVEFRYQSSAAIRGMMISCVTLALIGCVICIHKFKYPLFFVFIAGLIIVATGSFIFWYRSLYNGADLKTHYVWQERTYQNYTNLAYGKRTNMSPAVYHSYFEIKSSCSRAVDGVKTPASGFSTGLIQQPWWVIDLHRPKSLNEIVIYEGETGPNINQRPLSVAISNEGKNWQIASTVTEKNQGNPLRVAFNEPLETRYLMIRASGTGYLSIDEVEIHPTQNDR